MAITQEQGTGRFIAAGGIRIHYGDVGEGPPVVLLHGAGPGADGWGNFRHNIDALAGSHRVIVPDLPRFGRSDKPATDRPRLDFLADAIGAFLDALEVPRTHMIGNSLGGQTAMKLAVDRPQLVDRIVVVGSNALSRTALSPLPAEGVRLIANYYQGDGPTRDKMRSLLLTLVNDPARITDELLEARYQASIEPEIVAVNKSHWARQSLDDDLTRLTSPTLIVWGQDDRASPVEAAHMMLRLIPDARLHVFNRCGHWAQVERADEFNRLVLGFLAGA